MSKSEIITDIRTLPEQVRKFCAILASQRRKGVKSYDWPDVPSQMKIEKDDKGIDVSLEESEVGFAFTPEGEFVGVFNWKQ